jgi:hypothetical protein
MTNNIVKVQIALTSNIKNPPALIYDEEQEILIEVPADNKLIKKMGGEHKKYFYYEIIDECEVKLLNEAPWQDW